MNPDDNPAYTVYTEQLITLGHGLPLWEPGLATASKSPDEEEFGEVLIGDVGLVIDGSFRRFFNVTLPSTHPINKDHSPDDFKVLEYNRRLLSSKEDYIQPGPVCSQGVTMVDTEAEGDGGTDLASTAGVTHHFQCHGDQGAMLFLKDSAKREHAIPNRTFQNYMRQQHEIWYNYAENEMKVDCTPEDIILVRGSTKTTEWAVASWPESGHAHDVVATIRESTYPQVNLGIIAKTSSTDSPLPSVRSGPNRSAAKCDQCIFLHYYKIKYRQGFLPHRDTTTASSSNQNRGAEARVGALARRFHDPLDDALDYILKHSAAEVAIVSDGDISELLGNRQWPEDMAGYLRETMPKIDVDEDGTGTLSLEEGIVRNHAAEVEAAEHALNIQNANQQLQEEAETVEPEAQDAAAVDPADPNTEAGPEGRNAAAADPSPANPDADPEPKGQNATAVDPADPGAEAADPAPETPPEEGEGAAPPPNNLIREEPKVIPERLLSGTVVLRKHLQEGTAIDWPQHVLYDSTSEGGAVCSVSVSKDGRRIAGGFEDAIVRVWDLRSGVIVHRLEGHGETVWATQFSPTEDMLATASADTTAAIWNMATGRKIHTLRGHDGYVWSLAYSPNGENIATGSTDGTTKLWSAQTGELLATLGGDASPILHLSFSVDGSRLLVGAGSVGRVWNAGTHAPVASLEGHTNIIWCMAFSSDGSRVITGGEDNTGRIWSTDTGDELVILREHAGPIWAVSFSPDGKTVALGSYDTTATICNSYTGERHLLLRERPSIVNALTYSSDGEYLATGSVDGAVKVWETKTGDFVAELQGHLDKIKTLHFTPDGSRVVSSSDDGTIRVWSLTDILRL